MDEELEKVLNSWKSVLELDEEKLSKRKRELILQTVRFLEELRLGRL